MVGDLPRSGPRCAGSAGGRCQPESQGGLRAAARGPRGDPHRPRRLLPESHGRRQRDAHRKPPSIRRTSSPASQNPVNDFIVGAELSYEIDLFGRVRNTVVRGESQRAGHRRRCCRPRAQFAGRARERLLRCSAASMRSRSCSIRTVADYARALQLTENLYQGGAAAVADVQQARAQLETARTQAEDTRLRRAQTEHAIAVLVAGRRPTSIWIRARSSPAWRRPPSIRGLPSQLLERRPDVAAAERRVAAANAGIGVARAAYFPVFSLAGALGLESTAASATGSRHPAASGPSVRRASYTLRRRPAPGPERCRPRRRTTSRSRTIVPAF